MNKTQSSIISILLATLITPMVSFANDNQVVLNYDGFFDRMDDLDEAQYQDIKLAFYLLDKQEQPCPVNSVKLQTKFKHQEVYVLDSGEILLPFEPKLDQDKAAIVIDKKDSTECGLNMRLESSQLFNNKIPTQQIKSLINTFDLAFNDLGGMMSFMLPEVIGITFKFEPGQLPQLSNPSLGKCEKDLGCTLKISDLNAEQGDIEFNYKPIKAVPLIGS